MTRLTALLLECREGSFMGVSCKIQFGLSVFLQVIVLKLVGMSDYRFLAVPWQCDLKEEEPVNGICPNRLGKYTFGVNHAF